MTATTDYYGEARFTLSANMLDFVNIGAQAKIEVSAAGYAPSTTEKIISPGQNNRVKIYLVRP